MKLIKISAMWCPACLIMRPILNSITEFDIEQVEYDYDLDEDIVKTYNVGEILPVFIVMDNDKEVGRLIGEKTKEQVIEFLKGCLK